MKRIVGTISFVLIFAIQASMAQERFFHSDLEKSVLTNALSENSDDLLLYYLASDSNADLNFYDDLLYDLKKFEARLAKKKNKKDDLAFINHLFYKVHRKYLKNYRQYSTFYTLMDRGYYDCLSATVLYSYFLNKFQYDFSIIETNYHIYVLIQLEGDQILFESTDPLAGVVADDNEIARLISTYKNAPVANEDLYYMFNFNLENRVDAKELIGLLYYNLAIKAYNQQMTPLAVNYWSKASLFYNSKRMRAIESLLLEKNLISDNLRKAAPVAILNEEN